jgi:hypothetical protein
LIRIPAPQGAGNKSKLGKSALSGILRQIFLGHYFSRILDEVAILIRRTQRPQGQRIRTARY